MGKITPFLWFDGNAEEAVEFYCSVFPAAKVRDVTRAGPEGSVVHVSFELAGQEFHALNDRPVDAFFTEAVSFFVDCETQDEVDDLWTKLTADGGEESRCGWLKDKYGLSWQIIPQALGELMGDPDPAKAGRVMNAMLQMSKIVIADLQAAYDSK